MILYIILGLLLGVILTYIFLNKQNESIKKDIASEQFVNKRYIEEIQKLQLQIFESNEKYEKQLAANRDLIRQKSSIATKGGFMVETLSPILEKFPVDILDNNCSVCWLGQPIDYITFNFEQPMITFVEIKTGTSVLSKRQKLVKKMVEEGLIKFLTITMKKEEKIKINNES